MKDIILKQYQEMEISQETLKLVNEKLKLLESNLTKFSREKRRKALKEAISWESGPDQENRKVTILYEFGDYAVAVGKPGKEAAPDYNRFTNYKTKVKGNNPHDMNPQILFKGEKIGKDATFEDMFGDIEKLKRSDMFGLELFGMLMFRAPFMLDHILNKEGFCRYSPPEEILDILEKRMPTTADGIPIRVFIYFLEVLSLNEDIKVEEGGHGIEKDYGRINTLLTFANLIAVLINRRPLYKFAGQFARPPTGMAPIPKTERGGIFEVYPLLSPDFLQSNLK